MNIKIALERLSASLDQEEPGQSSHWKLMMQSDSWMSADAGARHGLGEFIRWNWKRGLLHFALQAPFRRMGRSMRAFPEILVAARRNASRLGRVLDLDDLRQVLSLACVREYLDISSGPATIAVIGDGYARLSSLLLDTLPHCRVVLVNLTRALYVDLMTLRRLRPDIDICLLDGDADPSSARVTAIPARFSRLMRKVAIDGAFNISSMQEMNPETVAHYFSQLRVNPAGGTWFYCANATAKRLPDGTMSRFDEYPWHSADEILLDELCPWAQQNYRMWPPSYFARLFNIRHRLVRLRKSI